MGGQAALLLIDVQQAMFEYPEMQLHEEQAVLDRLVQLVSQAREAKVPVIFVQHTTHDDDEFQEGSDSWQLHARLTPREDEVIVHKPTWDAFHQTDLKERLDALGIDKLIIAGMQTEFCLDTTCRRAYSLGYANVLIRDAHSTFDRETLKASQIIAHHNDVLGGRFATLAFAADVRFPLSL